MPTIDGSVCSTFPHTIRRSGWSLICWFPPFTLSFPSWSISARRSPSASLWWTRRSLHYERRERLASSSTSCERIKSWSSGQESLSFHNSLRSHWSFSLSPWIVRTSRIVGFVIYWSPPIGHRSLLKWSASSCTSAPRRSIPANGARPRLVDGWQVFGVDIQQQRRPLWQSQFLHTTQTEQDIDRSHSSFFIFPVGRVRSTRQDLRKVSGLFEFFSGDLLWRLCRPWKQGWVEFRIESWIDCCRKFSYRPSMDSSAPHTLTLART